jgi:two-component system response regulator
VNTDKRRKILIIDDDPNDIFMTKRALLKSGFNVEVEAATSGEAALEFLQKEDCLPSLILLDVKMPIMSGIETLRRIRADERLGNIRVVILTTSILESDKKEAYEAGANYFLNKAFDIGQLCADIKSILERWLKE